MGKNVDDTVREILESTDDLNPIAGGLSILYSEIYSEMKKAVLSQKSQLK